VTQLEVGQAAVLKRVFAQADFDRFAALSGDDNPIHVDPAFASRTRFGRTVCHGMLLYATICRALGELLPGPGTVQLEQEMMFLTPTYAEEEIAVRLEITTLWPESGTAELSTVITRPDGAFACQGRTRVRLPGSAAGWPDSPALVAGEPAANATVSPDAVASWRGLRLGQRASVNRAFDEADLTEYGDLTGDRNPVYRQAGGGGMAALVPGPLLGGLFSYLLGTRLPGRGTNWLKQALRFPAAAHSGQSLAANVEIVRLRPEKDLVNLRTLCTGAQGQVVCEGEALVRVQDLEHA
jgi:acyl dehydratase